MTIFSSLLPVIRVLTAYSIISMTNKAQPEMPTISTAINTLILKGKSTDLSILEFISPARYVCTMSMYMYLPVN